MVKTVSGLASIFEQDDNLLREIGTVISVWGALNHIVRSALADIYSCSHEEADALLQKAPGEGARLKILRDALSLRDDASSAAMRNRIDVLATLAVERNLIVHSGPIKGSRGSSSIEFQLVDFREPDPERRYKLAIPFVSAHLEQLRKVGGELFDLVYAAQIEVLDGRGFALAPTSGSFEAPS